MKRSPAIVLTLGFFAVGAVLWFVVQTQLPTRNPAKPTLTANDLPQAAPGELFVTGVLRPGLAQSYPRSYSFLGKKREEELRVVPLTDASWREGEPIPALAIVRRDYPEGAFLGDAVKLGAIDPSWSSPLSLAKDAALLELSEGQPPSWLGLTGVLAALVFLVLAVWGIYSRLRRA